MKIGEMFIIENKAYLLAQCGPGVVCLIHIKTGNRKRDPLKVKDVYDVSQKEFLEISGADSFNAVKVEKCVGEYINYNSNINNKPKSEIKRKAKIYYKQHGDRIIITKLEGFLSKNDIQAISPRVYELWKQQLEKMYFYNNSIYLQLPVSHETIFEGENMSSAKFGEFVGFMRRCGKYLSYCIKIAKEEEINSLKVVEI